VAELKASPRASAPPAIKVAMAAVRPARRTLSRVRHPHRPRDFETTRRQSRPRAGAGQAAQRMALFSSDGMLTGLCPIGATIWAMTNGASPGRALTFREMVMELRNRTGLSVKDVERLLREGTPPWRGDLSRYLHEEKRKFPRDLVQSLDAVFASRLPGFEAGSLYAAFLQSTSRANTAGAQAPSAAVEAPTSASSGADGPRRRLVWRYVIGGVVALSTLAALVVVLYPRDMVSGSVRCISGAPVVGVYVAINRLPGSDWAKTRPDPNHHERAVFNAEVHMARAMRCMSAVAGLKATGPSKQEPPLPPS